MFYTTTSYAFFLAGGGEPRRLLDCCLLDEPYTSLWEAGLKDASCVKVLCFMEIAVEADEVKVEEYAAILVRPMMLPIKDSQRLLPCPSMLFYF